MPLINYFTPQLNMLYKLVLMHDISFIGVLYSRRTRLATHSSAGSQPSRLLLVMPHTEMNIITETGQEPINMWIPIDGEAIYRFLRPKFQHVAFADP